MRPYIELWIDDELVEFKEPPTVLFTYAHIDLHNPTVVKNSFSKTLTVDGTPKNNRIFGCFGNMNRVLGYADGSYLGAYFNPSRKIDFILLRNSEPIERGYVKLDKVVKKGNVLQYEITLYGGLGQMLYNLTYNDEGEQLKLSDLEYRHNVDIDVNHLTVRDAWWHLTDYVKSDDIYDFINFAPCYNGVPQDFSADKVAINTDVYGSTLETSKDGYSTVNGWVLGELPKEYDEWQMKDLRSYMQRPVIRFKEIVDACCNPENNGGYEVDRDEEFFSESNPYWENAWMSLPLLTEVEELVKESNATIIYDDDGTIRLRGMQGNVRLTLPITLKATVDTSITNDRLYTGVQITLNPSRNTYVESYNSCKYVQLCVYDENDNLITGSNVLSFFTSIKNAVNFTYDMEYDSTVNNVTGNYVRMSAGNYMFNRTYSNLVIDNVEWQSGYYMKLVTKSAEIRNYEDLGETVGMDYLYKRNEYHKAADTITDVDYTVLTSDDRAVINDIFNNPSSTYHITKDNLLNSESTPCDYFLNYLKMFNLHIWADNIDKKIYIRQRKNYFNSTKVNLDKVVDRGSDITITPLMFDAKYYVFHNEVEQSSYINNTYKDNYGFDYGIKKVNTNYNFDNSTKELIEHNVFKGCVCQRGKSKYYADTYMDDLSSTLPVPVPILDGVKTYLYKEGDTVEGTMITPKSLTSPVHWYSKSRYDITPKPDFRDKDGKLIDGSNILFFYNGKEDLVDVDGGDMKFRITDDIPEFEQLNDGEPCWILGGTSEDSVEIRLLPIFSRYVTNDNGWVTHSWDFGTPKELYIDGWSIDESSDIYTQYWKHYLNDELSVDTREVDCKIWFKARVNPDMLQSFVYYDGCYWLIKEITDYDMTSEKPTKVKMVKIQDISNYLS